MKHQGLTESPAGKWTRAEDYVGALARKRSHRRNRRASGRTQSESPGLLLSTVPFLALIALLAVLALAIMISAFPGTQPQQFGAKATPKQQGVASRGWLQEAQKDFHK